MSLTKWCLEDLQRHAQTHGGRCLSPRYIGVDARYRWQCAQGHEWETRWSHVHAGHWCPYCAGNIGWDINRMRAVAESRGGHCLSDAYITTKTKLRFECAKGHQWEATPNNINNGRWCPICARSRVNEKRRRTIDDLKRHAITKGGECLSDVLPAPQAKVLWRCAHGHEWEATPQSVLGAGGWCPKCGDERSAAAKRPPNRLAELHALAVERGGVCLSDTYVSTNRSLKWRCSNGHEWSARPADIINGKWCPVCSSRLGERICREHFEQLFGMPFPKTKPGWLKSPTGTLLELDGYSAELKLAFEHHGIYHYEVMVPYSPTPAALIKRQALDAIKRSICGANGIDLIEIPEVPSMLPVKALKDFILAECGRLKRQVPYRDIEIDIARAYKPLSAQNVLSELASARGGLLVSSSFLGWTSPLTWRCAQGHEWKSSPASVLYQETWCPYCAGVIKKTIEEMRAVAASKGGDCISTEYLSARSPLRWRCAEGHEWEAAPTSIISRRSWCPYCAGQRGNHLTIESMRELARHRGGECLSEEYVNTKTKLRWRCGQGHEWDALPLNVVHKNSWCPFCARKRMRRSIPAT